MEDEEQKPAKKRMAIRIMPPEDQHPPSMEYFRRNLGEPDRMISMNTFVYVKVVGDRAGGLNNVEWRCGDKLRNQVIPARMGLDSIVQYVSVELKFNFKNKAHIKGRHGHGNCDRRNCLGTQPNPSHRSPPQPLHRETMVLEGT